jgi:hypothetical protein
LSFHLSDDSPAVGTGSGDHPQNGCPLQSHKEALLSKGSFIYRMSSSAFPPFTDDGKAKARHPEVLSDRPPLPLL